MVIVAGHLIVDASARDGYLRGCRHVVERARRAPGCLDFSVSPDLIDPCRIAVFERWASQAAVEAFRGDGVDAEQGAAIEAAEVSEYDVAAARQLTQPRQGVQ
ncbi:putative quinol monooxygenase [Mycobacterium sp. WMMD1722]|uniref:putative quinol monooxygenase n=1 Tax=Mycobacterium sp. WMMD1722 TaxID=3404117 RepID=UPI003BF4F191